ncbi:MAG: hypothetical protein Q7J57_01770 [Gemmobacter sp.]|nr:hypothetical protein [Gemmobacter sp.]
MQADGSASLKSRHPNQRSNRMRERKGKLLRFASGAASAQLISAASIPFLTYIYEPALLGIFFILDAYCDILSSGSTLAIDKAIYVNRSAARERAIIKASVFCVLIVSGLAGLLLPGLAGYAILNPELQGIILAVAAAVLVAGRGLFSIFQAIALKSGKFARVIMAENARASILLSGRIGFGVMGLGFSGLVISALLGAWGAVFVVGWGHLRRAIGITATTSITGTRATIRKYRDYLIYEGSSQFVRQLPGRALVILVGGLYSPTAAGAYSVGLLLCYRPTEVLVRSIVEIGRSEIAADLRASNSSAAATKARGIVVQAGLLACVVSPLLAIVLFFFSPYIFPEAWQRVGGLVLFSSFLSAMLLAARPLQVVFSLYQSQGKALMLDVLVTLAAFCGMTFAWATGFSLEVACLTAGAAMALILVYFIIVALRIAATQRPN